LVVLLDGVKRWILVSPADVPKLELFTSGAHYRHASFDWSDPSHWSKFAGVQALDVVLLPGEALWLPAGWVHCVI
jgi:hypothetical protein